MADYWKSIPKIHCDVCNVWYQDNKASVDFHERGFRHKANVQKKLTELRKRGSTQLEEQKQYNLEMMKIEAAARSAFEKDIASDPKLTRQTATSLIDKLPVVHYTSSTATKSTNSVYGGGRFGDEFSGSGESLTLVRGREKALDTIAKKLEKKSKWLEAVNAEGKTYYWNKETFETVWEKPKAGFLTIAEQKNMDISGPSTSSNSSAQGSNPVFRHQPYGSWKEVKEETIDPNMVDLELPVEAGFVEVAPTPQVVVQKPKEIEFEEKTAELRKTSAVKKEPVEFKKRGMKSNFSRNIKRRTDEDS